MKKAILFVGTLFLLLMAMPSYAQKTSKKQKISKKENVEKKSSQKNRNVVVKKAKKVNNASTPKAMTQISQKPKVVIRKLDPSKVFNTASLAKQAKRFKLRTTLTGFDTGDHSTISTTKETKKDGKFCSTTTLNTKLNTQNFSDFTTNGPPDWMKPGIILDVPSFIDGAAKIEERYNRGPITIATNAASAKKVSTVVENPRGKSQITQAISDLLSTDRNQLHAANITYSYSEIRSKDELNYKINGRYSNSFADISVQLGMTSNSEKEHHYYLVEFQQTLFTLEVDGLNPTNIFPNNPDINLSNYVYISQVSYGRKGYFMFITDTSLNELGVSASASASYLGHNAEIEANLNQISQTENVEVKAFYYGGRVDSAISDLTADRSSANWKPLKKYMEGHKFSEAEAYPISYKLKNLNNDPVGMSSTNQQEIETCISSSKNTKLKVTLLELQCDASGDSDKIGDFGLTQHVRYRANGGNWKAPIQTTINKFNNNCRPGDMNKDWEGSTALICGNSRNQIHVNESKKPKRRNPNINNSIVFEITPEEANDKQAEFVIDTWVKEYSNSDVVMNYDPRKTTVAIHDVIAILKGIKDINNTNTSSFFDGGVNESLKFYNFDGVSLPLRKVDNNILEGPIRARNKGGNLNQKAFVWMRFEIID